MWKEVETAGGERGVVMIPTAISRMERGEDREFLLELINENGSLMYAMALKILGNEPVANDMVSDACMALMKKTAYLRTIVAEKQRLYILAIVKNNCLMYLRKHSRERLFYDEHELETSLASEDAVDDALIADADSQMLREALRKVDERTRDLLSMKYFEMRSDSEIAEKLGIGKKSVRQYLTVARRKLKEELIRGGWYG
ncbi:MAG: sigma-70 family RNA polymerase sigma factor [Clostridia bacterium]|nr:sigma-70 family RNA polymerase sigma factor [Clostridia bacterium]